MRDALDIGIVGAGTAGSAAALLLARAGHRVTLFERVPAPSAVGAGIVLQPTGQSVLARLGLLGSILERGARIDRLRCETDRKRVVVDIAYADVDARLFGIGLHRGVLFEALFDAARAQENVRVELGVEITGCELEHDRRVLVDTRGERHGPFDLIVVADGAGSRIASSDVERRVSHYAWGALWCVLPDPERVYRGELYQVVRGARRMLGFLPTGRGPGERAENVVSLYWSLRADAVERWRESGLAPWKDEIVRLEPRAARVLDAIDAHERVLFAAYRDVVMPRWHGARMVWIGDAAHAMSPQLGQGANLALWDAMSLADAIEAHPTLESGLRAYSRARRPHLGFYQLATRWLTPFFQSDAAALGWLRDALMPIGLAIPYVKRRMVRSMAGIERGLVRAALPVDAVVPRLPR
ncbi:FAD-dependent oxidoreductase [Sandaracinus amylolyticus]|uniref:Oxidoreductase n=1 Tax=Sandaracinus amylolyticus TaxID=927083 RepID=A0A0F6VYI3_9BACT|nr:NAD(P)/FAD-dependent oxidoreductase [Sandaracinus amylolyticus]AKF02868.1 Oxidoreductase [Sandaracinus amylolyticus]